jgi:P4 family phage/plasmid primase-like protien
MAPKQKVYVEETLHSTARRLALLGYQVIPLAPATKYPTSKTWLDQRLTPEDVDIQLHPDTDANLGLILGLRVGSSPYFIYSIDVDEEDKVLMDRVLLSLAGPAPGKKGQKGWTIFVKSEKQLRGKKWTRKNEAGKAYCCVEFLGHGNQTVLPPSIHPNGPTYEWIGKPLYDWDIEDIPNITDAAMTEIGLAVKEPDRAIFFLNDMSPSSDKEAGTIHNSVLTAVASLVAMGWSDDVIWERVERAVLRADPDRNMVEFEQKVRRMMDDARTKEFDKPKKRKIHYDVAEWLLNTCFGPGVVFARNDRIVAYANGFYSIYPESAIKHIIATQHESSKGALLDNDWAYVARTALSLAPRFPSHSSNCVCFTNGTYNMDTKDFGKWSPTDFLISQLPFDYDPEAKCPVYEACVYRTLGDGTEEGTQQAVDCFEEFVALTLFEDLKHQKMLILKGETNSGKSTLAKIVEMMHDPRAVSHVGVKHLDDDRYKVTMVDKLLNISNEVSAATTHAADDVIKAITAGDPLEVRHLYGETFTAVISARLMVVCNNLFRTHDTSGAMERRMIILLCNNQLTKENGQDPHILEKIAKERSGIFNRMALAYTRLVARGWFNPPPLHTEAVNEFAGENNVVLQWIKARTHQGAKMEDPEYVMPTDLPLMSSEDLYMDCSEWMKAHGYSAINPISWAMRVNNIRVPGFDFRPQQRWMGGRNRKARAINLLSRVTKGAYE